MVDNVIFSSKKMDWETPQRLFDELNKEFKFEVDMCAGPNNNKCPIFLEDCFKAIPCSNWKSYFMNPPYGRDIINFIKRALELQKLGATVVCLVPARTDTKWWSLIWDHDLHKSRKNIEIRFLKGRLKFENNGIPLDSAPFPSAIIVMKGYQS